MDSHSKELYVSFHPQVYRSAKAQGLQVQASFLRILKYLHNLKILSRQKRDLREYLFKQLDLVIKEVDRIEEKFPKPEIPSSLRRKVKKSSSRGHEVNALDVKMKRDYSKRESIDAELLEIQRKLSALKG